MNNITSRSNLIQISILVLFIWSVVIVISALWNIKVQQELITQIVSNVAHSNFNKDLAYRKWASDHGGVYVTPTDKTPPNPYLAHIKDRDVITTDGKKLTLMNPAYMLRQMMDDYSNLYGVKGKITGIVYLNPNNKADAWEERSIKKFEKGVKEILEITGTGDNEYLRLMKPMIMNQKCQKCHGHLGFENGSVRGGVSISIPMKKYRQQEKKAINFINWTAFIIWFIGLISIIIISKYVLNHIKQREIALDELIVSHQILDNMLDAMFVTDVNGNILRVNKAFENITGFSKEEAIGSNPNILRSEHHNDAFYQLLWDNLNKNGKHTCEIFNRKKSGEIFVSINNITSVKNKNSEIKYFICIMHDITIRTDIPNRILFEIRFDHALALAKRTYSKVILAYIDLDGFKDVNDKLGHQVGDKLLQHIATILKKATRSSDTVARLGGDEFAVIIENADELDKIIHIIKKISKLLKQDIYIDNHRINISGSIGISSYPEDGDNIDNLIRCADMAMYHCKNNGKKSYSFYKEL